MHGKAEQKNSGVNEKYSQFLDCMVNTKAEQKNSAYSRNKSNK